MIILKYYTGVQKLAQEPALQLSTIYCCNIQNCMKHSTFWNLHAGTFAQCACIIASSIRAQHYLALIISFMPKQKALTLSGLVCKIVNCKTDVDCFFQNKLLSDVFKIILVGVKHRKLNGGYLFYEDDVTT